MLDLKPSMLRPSATEIRHSLISVREETKHTVGFKVTKPVAQLKITTISNLKRVHLTSYSLFIMKVTIDESK